MDESPATSCMFWHKIGYHRTEIISDVVTSYYLVILENSFVVLMDVKRPMKHSTLNERNKNNYLGKNNAKFLLLMCFECLHVQNPNLPYPCFHPLRPFCTVQSTSSYGSINQKLL